MKKLFILLTSLGMVGLASAMSGFRLTQPEYVTAAETGRPVAFSVNEGKEPEKDVYMPSIEEVEAALMSAPEQVEEVDALVVDEPTQTEDVQGDIFDRLRGWWTAGKDKYAAGKESAQEYYASAKEMAGQVGPRAKEMAQEVGPYIKREAPVMYEAAKARAKTLPRDTWNAAQDLKLSDLSIRPQAGMHTISSDEVRKAQQSMQNMMDRQRMMQEAGKRNLEKFQAKIDRYGYKNTELHSAVANNDLAEVKRLIEEGADPNLKGDSATLDGRNAYEYAVWIDASPEIIDYLNPLTEGYWKRRFTQKRYVLPALAGAGYGAYKGYEALTQ